MPDRKLPHWADEVRAAYLRGEASVFILHGNVHDLILHEGKLTPLVDFLSSVLLKTKEVICHYNPAIGIKFRKKERQLDKLEEYIGVREAEKALQSLEKLLLTQDKVGIIIDYAEMIAPRGDVAHQVETDRRSIVTLHRWSLDRRFDNSDNLVILITDLIPELSEKLVSNPKISSVEVPLPNEAERQTLVKLLEPEADERERNRLASASAGLKNIQLRALLAPAEDTEEDAAERRALILRLLGNAPNARERADKLAKVLSSREEILELLSPGGVPPPGEKAANKYDDVYKLLHRRKRAILEKECFGLIEFVDAAHGLDDVGGMEGVKQDLLSIARNIRDGQTNRVPMGLLFVGPMGSGKTFVAEAFAKSSGLTAIKLKNFRSKWVGSTEGNLEKILSVVKAIGNILVIIDEGDRAFGNTSGGDGDGGTSSRVIARIKEFMSDTTNRGRVLFVLMTNRPDKLDIDIKRAGRLDRKIPFFYGEEPEEMELILRALLKRHKVEHQLEWPRDRVICERLKGYSNADVEAVVLLANDTAHNNKGPVTLELMEAAWREYLPSRDATVLEYMELLAVFESSSRSMLPKRYRDIDVDELQARLARLRARMP